MIKLNLSIAVHQREHASDAYFSVNCFFFVRCRSNCSNLQITDYHYSLDLLESLVRMLSSLWKLPIKCVVGMMRLSLKWTIITASQISNVHTLFACIVKKKNNNNRMCSEMAQLPWKYNFGNYFVTTVDSYHFNSIWSDSKSFHGHKHSAISTCNLCKWWAIQSNLYHIKSTGIMHVNDNVHIESRKRTKENHKMDWIQMVKSKESKSTF